MDETSVAFKRKFDTCDPQDFRFHVNFLFTLVIQKWFHIDFLTIGRNNVYTMGTW